ncbi:myogenin-like [Cyanistes caeruleus]|uniref:myogenin-like n=1 Tax=Cyanistes caeruleus TaxID=156563 RepID=UPI000CDA64EC|nr:myogenin-like [Cyanistes caeruleus]
MELFETNPYFFPEQRFFDGAASECRSGSSSCSPAWSSQLEFSTNPSDHLLAEEAAEERNLHSLSSIVESIAVGDVAVTFLEEQGQN